jgi:hypothetical protein
LVAHQVATFSLKHYYVLVEQTNITQNHYYLVMCDEDGRDLVLNGIKTKLL